MGAIWQVGAVWHPKVPCGPGRFLEVPEGCYVGAALSSSFNFFSSYRLQGTPLSLLSGFYTVLSSIFSFFLKLNVLSTTLFNVWNMWQPPLVVHWFIQC